MKIAYTVQEAAEATGLSVSTIRAMIRENRLPARQYGTKILIAADDLRAFIDTLPEVA